MSTVILQNQPMHPPFRWSSLIQLILSALAALLLLGMAFLIAVTSTAQHISQGSGGSDLTQPFMVAASLAFGGILVLPSAWYAWKRIAFPVSEPTPRKERRGFVLILTLVVIIFVVGALLLGNWVSLNNQLSWLLLPPLNLIATGLPALWLAVIGTHGLIEGSPHRRWGVFACGLVLSPLVILILELLVLIGLGIIAILWAALNPGFANQLHSLIFRLQNASPNPDTILRILLPFLLNPGILFLAFAMISVIAPLIEETLKPIGLWFLAGQKLAPAQGFAYGVLSGIGFGLFENLEYTSAGGEAWAALASARITTLLLHTLTAGLVGWALASAWSQKHYLRLGLTYVCAVVIHGLWNGMSVLSSVTFLDGLSNVSIPAILLQLGHLSSIGIIALCAFNLVLFISMSTILRNNLKHSYSGFSFAKSEAPHLVYLESSPQQMDGSFGSAPPLNSPPPPPSDDSSPVAPGDDGQFLDQGNHPSNSELNS